MKIFTHLLVLLTASLLLLTSCSKSNTGPAPGASSVDLKKLQDAFPSPTLMVQSSLDKLKFLVNQGRFEAAENELTTMSRIPNLTAEQKQAIGEVTDQVKKVAAAHPAQPAQ